MRWLLAYSLGCLAATPILVVGALWAYGAATLLMGLAAVEILASLIILLILCFIGCLLIGILPTPATYLALIGARRDDLTSYAAAGALSWGIIGFLIGAFSDLASRTGPAIAGNTPATINVFGSAVTAALAGALILGILWSRAIRRDEEDDIDYADAAPVEAYPEITDASSRGRRDDDDRDPEPKRAPRPRKPVARGPRRPRHAHGAVPDMPFL